MKLNAVLLNNAELNFLEVDQCYHLTDDEVDHLIYDLEWKYPLSASRGIYNMGTSYEFANIKAVGHEFDSAVFRLIEAMKSMAII